MKRVYKIFVFIGLIFLLSSNRQAVYPVVEQQSFQPGEELTYRVSFGFIGIGDARMVIDERIRNINDRPVYKVDVYGKTTGMVDWVAQVDDHWGSYVDTAALLPHISYRNIREGNYRKNEISSFDHNSGRIETKTLDQETGRYKPPKIFESKLEQVRDMLSGYLYLRSVDFSRMNPGDHIQVNGFLEDKFYPMKLVFDGYEKIRTKAGKFRAIRLIPIMPEDGIFDGK
ncbi:MAG: DUF3108 domain-containing protein, partial [Cyclobacteriaceae bacterium]